VHKLFVCGLVKQKTFHFCAFFNYLILKGNIQHALFNIDGRTNEVH